MLATKQIIDNAVRFIKEKIEPETIYLFGSYAKGTSTENSDLDFLIIQKTSLPRHKRTRPLYSLDKTRKIGLPIGIDFLVYTPEEFKNKMSEPNSIVGEVLRTGKILYGKQP
jgi:predicted nucleotidyltransferase